MNQHNIYKLKLRKEKLLIITIQISLVVVLFALWELFAKVGILDKFLFSCPSEISCILSYSQCYPLHLPLSFLSVRHL